MTDDQSAAADLWDRWVSGDHTGLKRDLTAFLKSTYGIVPGCMSAGQLYVMLVGLFPRPAFDTETVTLLRGIASTEDPTAGYFYVADTRVGQAVAEHYARKRFGTRGRIIEATFPADAVWAALPRIAEPPAVSFTEFIADPELIESVDTLFEVR